MSRFDRRGVAGCPPPALVATRRRGRHRPGHRRRHLECPVNQPTNTAGSLRRFGTNGRRLYELRQCRDRGPRIVDTPSAAASMSRSRIARSQRIGHSAINTVDFDNVCGGTLRDRRPRQRHRARASTASTTTRASQIGCPAGITCSVDNEIDNANSDQCSHARRPLFDPTAEREHRRPNFSTRGGSERRAGAPSASRRPTRHVRRAGGAPRCLHWCARQGVRTSTCLTSAM
jgi:hypothetical protein